MVLPTSETDALFAAAAHRLRADSETHLLDVACCIGQVLRALHVLEGVPARQLAGTDLRQEFLDTGFDLWRDRERFEGDGAQLVAGDLLAEDDEPLKVLDGRFALVHAGSFFHLFDWPTQVRAARRIVRFLRPPPPPQPERPADSSSSPTSRTLPAIVFGRQLGSLKPEELPVLSAAARGRTSTRFLHDEASFQRLWNEVGAATDTRWQVHVEILDKLPPNMPSFNEHTRLIRFAAVRVEG